MDANDPVFGYRAGASGFFLGWSDFVEVRGLDSDFWSAVRTNSGGVNRGQHQIMQHHFHGSLF